MGKLLNVDAIEMLKSLKTGSASVVFTDPPYNTTKLGLDKTEFSLNDFNDELMRILKPNGWFFCFGSYEMGAEIYKTWERRFEYVWDKGRGMQHGGARMPVISHELIFVSIKPGLKKLRDLYFDKVSLRTEGTPYVAARKREKTEFQRAQGIDEEMITINDGYREGKSVLKYKSKSQMRYWERSNHPTQKPLKLCEYVIKGYCEKGGLVVDPFMGSGTIPLAAKHMGRDYIGSEISEKYYNEALRRFGRELI